MALDAVFGFARVLLGSATTSILTIYRDRLTVLQENAKRDQQYERDRQLARDEFQRENILALQSAAADLIVAAYAEMDRMGIVSGHQQAQFPPPQSCCCSSGWPSTSSLRIRS